MTESRDVHAETVGDAAEVQQLRNRIRALESQVRASQRDQTPAASTNRTKLAATLAGLTALMAVPTFITVRRWVRWWS